jgi:hypothetical protein
MKPDSANGVVDIVFAISEGKLMEIRNIYIRATATRGTK